MPPMPAAAQPWKTARSSARAIWIAAWISGSTSGSRAPRAMLSSSARGWANGARSSARGCTCRMAAATQSCGDTACLFHAALVTALRADEVDELARDELHGEHLARLLVDLFPGGIGDGRE